MRLYFKCAELLLERNTEGKFVLQMGSEVLGTFTGEKRAVSEYNRIRRDLESKMPPAEMTDAERRELLERFLADDLVKHNSLRAEVRKKPAKSRTFG